MKAEIKDEYEWIVVGAGPGGIASVGKLLDAGVVPTDIAWIDPQFNIGDFGTAWRYVTSNTTVDSFLKYFRHCEAFSYSAPGRPSFMIEQIPSNNNCPLMLVTQVLQGISAKLRETVHVFHNSVVRIAPVGNIWELQLAAKRILRGRKIILCIGGTPRKLQFSDIVTIPLQTALNPNELENAIQPDDEVIVIGSAQSAKSVVENLSKIQAKKITLFYRSEASLNRHFQNDALLRDISTLEMTPRNLLAQLPNCTKAIYAIGFERRHIPIVGLPACYSYNKENGEIAPGIFGIGMAFPEILPYEMGHVEYPVTAIWPFMMRLEKLMPAWLA